MNINDPKIDPSRTPSVGVNQGEMVCLTHTLWCVSLMVNLEPLLCVSHNELQLHFLQQELKVLRLVVGFKTKIGESTKRSWNRYYH